MAVEGDIKQGFKLNQLDLFKAVAFENFNFLFVCICSRVSFHAVFIIFLLIPYFLGALDLAQGSWLLARGHMAGK